jgi:hypothetical protein
MQLKTNGHRVTSVKVPHILLISGVPILLFLYGCTALLPSSKAVVRTPWNNFQEAASAYNKVTTNETTMTQLRRLGFDLYSTPNVKILNYLDIAVATQNIRTDDLGGGLARCLKARNACRGYQFSPRVMKNERIGNFWLDMLNFRRKTKGTGWQFTATFLVIDDIVVDKFWNGTPTILEDQESKNPLGPLQDAGGLILRLIP